VVSSEELMQKAKQGDTEAFGALAARYRPRLERFAARVIGDGEAARDACQDILLRLWQKADLYDPQDSFEAFLYTLARNVCLRKAASDSSHRATGPVDEDALSVDPDPLRGRQVAEAVQALPEDQRLVFILSEYEGLSYEQIAQVVGCPKGTVGSRKHAAVQALRERLLDGR